MALPRTKISAFEGRSRQRTPDGTRGVRTKARRAERASEPPDRRAYRPSDRERDLRRAQSAAADGAKLELLKILGSNCSVIRKNVDFTLLPPFQTIANRPKISEGGASRDTGRTWDEILHRLVIIIRDTPRELFDRISCFLSTTRNEDPTLSSTRFHQASSNNGNVPAG